MIVTLACPTFREGRLLPAVALVTSLAMTISAIAQGQSGLFAKECAVKEVEVITLIEDHGAAGDMPADRLSNAGLTMLHAQSACYEGRVGEALALYQSILDLGPVASPR
jgi:hypothetical protein